MTTVVQVAQAAGPSGTFPANVTPGNTVILLIAGQSGGAAVAPAVSGCKLGTSADNFRSLGTAATVADASGNPGTMAAAWIDPSSAGGSNAFSVVMASGTAFFTYAIEVSGWGTNPALDAHASVVSQAGTNTFSSGATGVPTGTGELALGITAHGEFVTAGTTLTGPASPWVNSASSQTGGYAAIAGYQVLGTPAAVTYAGSSGTAFDYYVAMALTVLGGAAVTDVAGSEAGTGTGAQALRAEVPAADAGTGAGAQAASVAAGHEDTATGTGAQSLRAAVQSPDAATGAGSAAVALPVAYPADGDGGLGSGDESAAVPASPPLTGVALAAQPTWEVFVWEGPAAASGDGYGELLAQLPGWTALSISPLGNAVGAGQVTVPLQSSAFYLNGTTPETSPLLSGETLWQVRQDGTPVFEFLAQTVDWTTASGDEAETVTISGPGTAQCLNWLMAMPFGWQPEDGGFIGVTGAIQDPFTEQDQNGHYVIDAALWNLSTPGACTIPASTASYTQATAPAGTIPVGAVWHDTSKSPVTDYTWDGYAWVANFGGSASGGSVRVALAPGGAYLGGGAFNFVNSSFSAQVSPAQPLNPAAPGCPLGNDPCNGSDVTALVVRAAGGPGYVMLALGYQQLYAAYADAGGNLTTHQVALGRAGGTGAYDSSWASYWRVSCDARAGGGYLMRWWTSGDGTSWTLAWSLVTAPGTSWDASQVEVFMGGSYGVTGADGAFAQFTALNGEIQANADAGPIYLSAPAMAVVADQLARAAARGTAPFINPTFSDSADSAGAAWGDAWSVQVPVGTDGLSLTQNYAGAINASWLMLPGYRLYAALDPGRDLSGAIVFHPGEFTQAGRTRTRDQIYNVSAATDGAGMIWTQADPASVARWGQRETFTMSGGTIDAQAAVDTAAASVDQWGAEADARTVQVPPNLPGKTVFRDFGVFDWIGVERQDASATDAVQVIGITVSIDQDGAETHELVLTTYRQVLAQWYGYLLAKFGGQAASTLGALTAGTTAGSAFSLAVGPSLAVTPARLGGSGSSAAGLSGVAGLAAAPEVAAAATVMTQPASVGAGAPPVPGGVIPGSLLVAGSVAQEALGFTLPSGAQVTFSATAPADPRTGDLWYDEAAGNALYQWSGTSWQPYLFGAAAISATAADLGGVQVFSQATAPTGAINAGSIWYDTANGNAQYVYGTGGWAAAPLGAGGVSFGASDIGGVQVFMQDSAPAGAINAGSLWYDGAAGNALYVYGTGGWSPYPFGTAAIAAGSVTTALLAAGAVTAAKVTAGTITASLIAAGAITASQIAASTITSALIAAGTITSAQVAASTILGSNIAAGTITAANIAAGTITATQIAAGTITAAEISASTVVAGIVDGTTVSAAVFTGSVFEGSDWRMTDGGGFFYGGAPAKGNLAMSVAAAAGTESYGNAFEAGLTAYGAGGQQVRVYVTGANVAVVAFPSGAATEELAASMSMTVESKGLANELIQYKLQGPQSTYDSSSVAVVLDSSNANGAVKFTGYMLAGSGTSATWSQALFSVTHQLWVGAVTGGAATVEVAGNGHFTSSLQVDANASLGSISSVNGHALPMGTVSQPSLSSPSANEVSLASAINGLISRLQSAGFIS